MYSVSFFCVVLVFLVFYIVPSSKDSFKRRPQKAEAAAGPAFTVDIDLSKTTPVSKNLWGGNFYPVSSTAQGLYNRWNLYNRQSLRDLGIKLIRYPGGWLTNATAIQNIYPTVVQPNNTPWNPLVGEWRLGCGPTVSKFYMPSMDQVASLSAEIGADILFEVSLDYKRLGTAGGFCSAYGESQLDPSWTPEQKEAKVKEFLKADLEWVLNTYPQLRILELGNEPWEAYTVDDYAGVAKEFADSIKKHDPSLHVILVGLTTSTLDQLTNTWNPRIKQAFQNDTCGTNHTIPCYDSISIHPYIRHGYSNPDDWLIPTQYPPNPNALYTYPHVPDFSLSTLMPLIQYRRQIFIDSTLQKAIDIVCPYSVRTDSYKWTHCTSPSEVNLTNYRGVGNEKYKGISIHTYFKDGIQYFREILISNDSPPKVYQRDCPVHPQTGINCSSSSWHDMTNTLYYVKNGTNMFDFTDYDAVVYADNQNHQWIRETFVNGTTSFFQRTCTFINGSISDCGDWLETNAFQAAVKGVAQSITSAYVPCPTCYNNYAKNTWGYTLQETFLLDNGSQGYERFCAYNRVNNTFSCPPGFSGPHPGFSKFLTPFDGIDDEKYADIARTILYSDNSNLYDMPQNFPGIDAVYGVKENADHYTYTADALGINPSQLQITEWHNNCWSTLCDYSVLSVEEAFYIGENIFQMAKLGIPSAVFHDITEAGAEKQNCSFFKQQNATSYTFRPSGQSFALTSVAAGGEMADATVHNNSSIQPTPIPTIFRCPPKSPDCMSGGYSIDPVNVFPVVSEDRQKLYVFAYNRDTNSQEIQLNFNNQSQYRIQHGATYDVKTLDGQGKFTNKDFIIREETNQPLSDSATLTVTAPPVSIVRYSLPLVFISGDANMDGKADGLDYTIWLSHYGQPATMGSQEGDFNNNGTVDGMDYVIWVNNYTL